MTCYGAGANLRCRSEEGAYFLLQCVDLSIDRLVNRNLRRRAVGSRAATEDADPALDEIDGGTGILLKYPHLALQF